jgi:putative hydrolase of the HAD superfamily
VVFSTDLGIRKPDPAIFTHTPEQLDVSASSCVFADDSEEILPPAAAMGMTVLHALDERVTAVRHRALLGLAGARSPGLL